MKGLWLLSWRRHQGTVLKNRISILPVSDPGKQAVQVINWNGNKQMYRLSATDTKGQCFRKCIASTKISNEHSSSCHDVWRLLILSNEEKTNDYENFEKGMIYMKILKKGGVAEKRGEEEMKSMPHAPVKLDRRLPMFLKKGLHYIFIHA